MTVFLTAKVCDEVIKVVNVVNVECSVFGYFGICVFVYLCVCCCVGGLLEILTAKVCDEVIKVVNVVCTGWQEASTRALIQPATNQ